MTMMMTTNANNDTSLTKVFVGGLAWETPKEAMSDHFHQYGDILEAVIISDKLTGRSKGYGFVTFKDPEAAKKACQDPTPIINGRRANCNLAALGARRPSRSSSSPNNPPQQGVNVGPRATAAAAASPPPPPPIHVQWYYPSAAHAAAAPSPFHPHHQHQAAVPFYGYSPTYIAGSDMNYNHNKLGYSNGSYMNGHYSSNSQVYHGQAMVGPNALLPFYPVYHFHHQHSQAMGLPAHLYSPGPILMPKPTSAGTAAAVGQHS